jgi:hypothetical protein
MLLAVVPAPVTLAGSAGLTCQVRNVAQDTTGPSVRTMVAAAQDGDRLRVRGTCIGAVVIDRDLTITGVDSSARLSGGDRARVLRVRAGATVTLSDLIISDGAARTGGGIHNAGTLTLVHVRIRDNRAGPDHASGLDPIRPATTAGATGTSVAASPTPGHSPWSRAACGATAQAPAAGSSTTAS